MRFLAILLFIFFLIFMIFARWYFVCEVRQKCEEEVVETDIRLKTLKLTQGDTILLQGYDQFAFDSAVMQPRLNGNNVKFLDTLAEILAFADNKNLNITSFYRESEADVNNSFFENMGLARAAEIRKLLVANGIDEDRISLDHGISEDPELKAPLLYGLFTPSDVPDEYNLLFTFTNMTFSDANFKFDSDEFEPGEAFVMYADSVKTYLEVNKEKKLTIVGHTDNKGSERYNFELGMRRAKSAREYFKELGVVKPIEIDSKGEKHPTDTNKSEKGRQKNRRVNFVLN